MLSDGDALTMPFIREIIYIFSSIREVLNRLILLLIILLLLPGVNQKAISQYNSVEYSDTLEITLEEAVRIALENNFGLQDIRLDREASDQQVREAWSGVYPQVNVNANYTRNLVTANPFAGSSAQDLFASFGAIGWLNYNEQARMDSDATTQPITYDEYLDRQTQGYEDAGIAPPSLGDDPFSIDNQFITSLNITQTLFNGAAFAAIRGAEQFKKLSDDAVHRERQVVIDEVRKAFFSALLVKQQVDVLKKSVERLSRTVEDAQQTAEQGLSSRYEILSAEVELVNLETDLIDAENQAELAVKRINLILNMDVSRPIRLSGDLTMAALQPIGDLTFDESVDVAMEHRRDLQQAEGLIELRQINANIGRAAYRPVVSAFANLDYIGRVPDNRQSVITDSEDPFRFESQNRSFFYDPYWNPNVAVGINLRWNIFNGFQNQAVVQQRHIETRKSELQYDFLKKAIHLEVDQALKDLRAAERRIESQKRNIEQAQMNYDFARTRLLEGVGNNLEERQASMLLDQSQLFYLAAIHDYLAAVSNFELVIGTSINNVKN